LSNNPFTIIMTASTPVATDQNQLDLAEKNRQVVEQFFVILETHTQEELLKIFAPDAVRSIPYAHHVHDG
jgi:hypothetical protein